MDPLVPLLTVLTLSSALLGGLLFVFSNFAMRAFSDLPARSGVAAMQAINARILNPVFFVLFFGTALGSLAVLVLSAMDSANTASGWIIGGAVLLLAGLYVVTARCNVPLNNKLDEVDPEGPDAEEAWKDYVSRWQPWNHLRTVICFVSAALYMVGALTLAAG